MNSKRFVVVVMLLSFVTYFECLAEDATKTGSGLGLAITKKITERHGGTIKAANTEEGLQIQINLPTGRA